MERTTIYRFSKLTGIPANQLNHVLVSKMIGANKDLLEVYKSLKRDQLIRNSAKRTGKSFQDVLNWLENS